MDRFELVSRQAILTGNKVQKHGSEVDECLGAAIVLRDKQTGVLYLWCRETVYNDYGTKAGAGIGGLTVMLDQDGKPVTMNYSVNI